MKRTIKTNPEANPSAALVKSESRNHLTSFVSSTGPLSCSRFNVANKHGIDVGPITNPAAVTDTMPVKTGKKLYKMVATNADSWNDIEQSDYTSYVPYQMRMPTAKYNHAKENT